MATIQLSPALHTAVKSMKASELLQNESASSAGKETSLLTVKEAKALNQTFDRSVKDRVKAIAGDWA